jgi:PKHD-type hydroxylase
LVVTIDNVLSAEELAAIRDQLLQAEWAAGISAGPQALTAKNNQQLPETAPCLPDLRRSVMRALNRSSLLLTAVLPFKILPPNFNLYTGQANRYGPHVDSTLRPLPDGSYLRADVSATLFLSAPSEYDGGELSIEDIYGAHRIKLAAGSLVAYPAGSLHEVLPVTRGRRLACYLFIQSLVKDAAQRRHLFDMDMALMALRARYGEGEPELVRLTGLYNNLLQRWTEC